MDISAMIYKPEGITILNKPAPDKNEENDNMELTDEQAARNDEIDNAVQDCICTLAERDVDWDMSIIGDIEDSIEAILAENGIHVRHPGFVMDESGKEHYEE